MFMWAESPMLVVRLFVIGTLKKYKMKYFLYFPIHFKIPIQYNLKRFELNKI